MILFLDTVSPSPVFSIIKENKVVKSIQILNKNSNKISDCIIPAYLTLQNELRHATSRFHHSERKKLN